MKNGRWLKRVLVPNITSDCYLGEQRIFPCCVALSRESVENTNFCPPSFGQVYANPYIASYEQPLTQHLL